MHVKQNLSILFFPKNQKLNKKGKTTLYVRVTVDGLKDEFSSGIQIPPKDWNREAKTVFESSPNFKTITKKLKQIEVDLERCFDLIQAKDGTATAKAVGEAYQTPINGNDLREQTKENLQLSEQLDPIIEDYVMLCKKRKRVIERGEAGPEKLAIFDQQKKELVERVKTIAKHSQKVFDDKGRVKTFILAIDEYLLHFLQLAVVGERSENSLEKWMGRKKRYLAFLNHRFKASDLPLDSLEFKFLDDLKKYIMMYHGCEENTATKYAQCIKEVMDRAVSNKWISANIFSTFQCSYSETQMNWLELHDMESFAAFEFSKEKYNLMRDVYVAGSFTGFAYADLHAAEPGDIFMRDGKEWIQRNRQKTGVEEAVPLLPIVKRLIEKYKNHPLCVRKNRLFPVPTNQEYNRCLKEMGKECGFQILTQKGKGTHRMRYFMVNEVLYNNDVPLKTIGKIVGQKSIKTTEKYVRPNKKHISASMAMVKEKLFDDQGNLITKNSVEQKDNAVHNGLKVVHLKRS
jgi:hypothetical protein